MGLFDFFKRLFAGRSQSKSAVVERRAAKKPEEGEGPIQVYDEYGRPLQVDRETWRKEILPSNIQHAWNDAEALYSLIVHSLNDGLAAEMIKPAEQLMR